MSKDYWYILHIPSGNILEYSDKNYSKVRHSNWKKAQKGITIPKNENKLLHKLGLHPAMSNWEFSDIPAWAQQSDSSYAAWATLPGANGNSPEHLKPIQAQHFATLIETKRSNSIMKFTDKLDARDCLKYLMEGRLSGNYSIDEFAVLCSDGSVYDFQAQTLAAKQKARQVKLVQDNLLGTT